MRIAAVAAAAVVLVIAARAFNGEDADASPSHLAQSLMQSGDYARAAETLRAAYRASPSEELRFELARALLGAGDYESVIEVLQTQSDDASVAYFRSHLRAEAFIRMRRFNEAETTAAEISRTHHKDGRASLIMARAAYGLGDGEGAKSNLSDALRAGGETLADAWLFRAKMALADNDLAVTRSAFTRAAEAGATPRSTIAIEIETLIREGDFKSAQAKINALKLPKTKKRRRIMRVDPQKEYFAAFLDAAQGDYKTATRRLRSIEPWVRGEPQGALLMAMARDHAGDGAQAESQYLKVLMSAPHNPAALTAYVDRLVRLERYDEAKSYIDDLLLADRRAGLSMQMRLASATGDDANVIATAKQLAGQGLAPSAAAAVLGAHSQAAVEAHKADGLEVALIAAVDVLLNGAIKNMQSAADRLSADFDSLAARIVAGELYLAVADDASAAQAFDQALALDPDFAPAILGKQRVDIRSGDLLTAEAVLAAELEASPHSFATRMRLARFMSANGKISSAALLLRDVENAVVADLTAAVFYVTLLKETGDLERTRRFAEKTRHAHPAAPAAVVVLDRAGLLEAAALTARDALIEAPADASRVHAYVDAMSRIGRGADAVTLLSALLEKRPNLAAAKAAVAAAAEDAGLMEATPAVSRGAQRISDLRRAYITNPTDAQTASQYGIALVRAGKTDSGMRVLRESCFWGLPGGCKRRALRDS